MVCVCVSAPLDADETGSCLISCMLSACEVVVSTFFSAFAVFQFPNAIAMHFPWYIRPKPSFRWHETHAQLYTQTPLHMVSSSSA